VSFGLDTGVVVRRALSAVAPPELPCEELEVLVVGSGIAGLTVATSLPPGLRVAVTTKAAVRDGSTWHAQGGVAASIGADDTPRLHLEDTVVAGSGLCDDTAVRVLTDGAADAIRFLERCGVRLDHEGPGRALTREGGHSRNRIVHAGGDATGAEIVRALDSSARTGGLLVHEGTFLVDLLLDEDGSVAGAVLLGPGGLRWVRCPTVVLASGGYGQLFAETTSPVTCTGDGAAAALRAGADLADLEFVQFHPTTLAVDLDPRPLLSEAMRGEGAVLRDRSGALVTEGVHPLGDLAPRDIVSRAVAARMASTGADHLFLDATALGASFLERRFPTITATCRALGIDPAVEAIPIAPGAHYTMGGVRTDLDGRTSVAGLFAVGEVAATGVHGANRLASNSLLEGVVFGRRVASAIDLVPPAPKEPLPLDAAHESPAPIAAGTRTWLRRAMVDRAGVTRDGEGLRSLAEGIAAVSGGPVELAVGGLETENLVEIATALTLLAASREESRGAHYRSDFPAPKESWHRHQVITRGAGGTLEIRREVVDDVDHVPTAFTGVAAAS
jgi:L-aspartate oxidase